VITRTEIPWLVIGGDGAIGHALSVCAPSSIYSTTRRTDRSNSLRPYLDLAEDVQNWTPPCTHGVAIFCASTGNLRACADSPRETRRINVEQVARLAKRLAQVFNFRIVFLSSTAVFDGVTAHCSEQVKVNPQSEYGLQKHLAEQEILQNCPGALVVRLTKVIHTEWPLWQEWRHRLRNGQSIRAYANLAFAPISLPLVVQGLAGLINAKAQGVYHWGGHDDLTYVDAARFLASRLGELSSLVEVELADPSLLPTGSLVKHASVDTSLVEVLLGYHVPSALATLEWLEKGV